MSLSDVQFVAFFMLLHVVFLSLPKANYIRAMKLSRGVAAVILSLVGFYGLFADLGEWQSAFIFHHTAGDAAERNLHFCMLICMGHFVADLLWLVWG